MAGRGVMTFELKEARQNKLKLVESASTHISMWVNCIVPISASRFLVFDQERNIFIFEKNLLPTTIEEKFKLKLIGSFCAGEEIKSAAFGSLQVIKGGNLAEDDQQEKESENRLKEKKKSYLRRASVQQKDVSVTDHQMVEEEEVK